MSTVFMQDRRIECGWLWLIKVIAIIGHNSPAGGAPKDNAAFGSRLIIKIINSCVL